MTEVQDFGEFMPSRKFRELIRPDDKCEFVAVFAPQFLKGVITIRAFFTPNFAGRDPREAEFSHLKTPLKGGVCRFMRGLGEVRTSTAHSWLSQYSFDGLPVSEMRRVEGSPKSR